MLEFVIAAINPALFKEQLNAALSYAPPCHIAREGDGPAVITIAREDLVLGDEVLVQDVIDAHDARGLTEAQAAALEAASRQEAARDALALADPDALLAQIGDASTVEALRSAVLELGALVRALVDLAEG